MPGSPVARRWTLPFSRLTEVSVIGASLPTTIAKAVLLLSSGNPLSVIQTVTAFVLSACAADGFQVNTPLLGSMKAPAGAPTPRLNVSRSGGMSGSKAVFVMVNNDPGRMVCRGTCAISGELFASFTTTVKLPLSLNGGAPLSVTRRVMRLVLGRWASVGVQLNTPVLGSRRTPSGADMRP